MFEQTATGWRATDEQVAFWAARDVCPACTGLVSPAATVDGVHYYSCPCQLDGIPENLSPYLPVRWTRPAAPGGHVSGRGMGVPTP
jgi:hypothetical protein